MIIDRNVARYVVFAEDPFIYGGAWTAAASQKVTRAVDLASTFHLPLVHLVDCPGFLIGLQSEQEATIRHGSRALAALRGRAYVIPDDLKAIAPAVLRHRLLLKPEAEIEVPSLARAEWEHINRVLADCEGNISEAARRLGLHRRSLQRKLQKRPPSK